MPQAKRRSGAAPMSQAFAEDEGEHLTPEEEAALAAEQSGAEETPPPGLEEPPAKPGEQPEKPQEPAKPEDEVAAAKEPSSAQKRIQALIDERNKIREERDQEREKWARLEERAKLNRELQEQAQRAAEAQKQAAERPDPDIDPQGARMWDLQQQVAQQNAALQQFQNQFQQYGQLTQQQMVARDLEMYLNSDYQRVRTTRPDIDNAIEHLHQTRVRLNQGLGYTPEQAEQLWQMERQAYVAQARQNGVSVNEFGYQMALATGYQPQANAAVAQPNGAPRAVTPEVMPNGRDRVAQLQAAQKAQGLGGKVAAAETDQHANIRNMTAQQFNDWLESFGEGDAWTAIQDTDPALWKMVQWKFQELG